MSVNKHTTDNNRDKEIVTSRIERFRHYSPKERLCKVFEHSKLDKKFENHFNSFSNHQSALSLELANSMIENVIGKFELPLGIATNFIINHKEYLIPMVVEEPSVVAAASHMAKIVRNCGGFMMESDQPIMRAQIQVLGLDDIHQSKIQLLARKNQIIEHANKQDPTLISLGGGCKEVEIQLFDTSPIGPMLVLHLLVDVRDAMGANTVNTMAEAVAPLVEKISLGKVRLRILSNLADKRLVRGKVTIPFSALTTSSLSGAEVARGIVEACALALIDPYRAATHNKGIMNGVDPVVIATGNDWRAIEAGAHAWAANEGKYKALSNWQLDGESNLIGSIEMPMALGTVGGATKTHPSAQAALALMDIQSAQELAKVAVAVGLAQNMAALKALATEGIQRGHMTLHAKNIAIAAGAKAEQVDIVATIIVKENSINLKRATEIIGQLR